MFYSTNTEHWTTMHTEISTKLHADHKSLNSCLSKHLLKWLTTANLRLKPLPHKPQQNCLNSVCTGWCCLKSAALQKCIGHLLQAYDFTPVCRSKCAFSSPLLLNFFWQMLHVNQVPSLCDFSRCVFSWPCLLKCSEQCLHEYGFAPVWIRTWSFRLPFVLNCIPQ